ncbi:MAG: 50S ribosomal protein L7/L12 [Planctomycetes bacterium]|nr:50S ribosomal protein L7/L12 [Planctomycetota bacterium]
MTTATASRSEKVIQVLDIVKGLTVIELVELVKAFEADFGVSAAAPAAAMFAGAPGAPGGAAAPPPEEKTSFDVILKGAGEQKIQVIKEVRAIANLGLKEAKDLVDNCPKPVKTGVSKEEAEKIKEKIKSAGGEVEIK